MRKFGTVAQHTGSTVAQTELLLPNHTKARWGKTTTPQIHSNQSYDYTSGRAQILRIDSIECPGRTMGRRLQTIVREAPLAPSQKKKRKVDDRPYKELREEEKKGARKELI